MGLSPRLIIDIVSCSTELPEKNDKELLLLSFRFNYPRCRKDILSAPKLKMVTKDFFFGNKKKISSRESCRTVSEILVSHGFLSRLSRVGNCCRLGQKPSSYLHLVLVQCLLEFSPLALRVGCSLLYNYGLREKKKIEIVISTTFLSTRFLLDDDSSIVFT